MQTCHEGYAGCLFLSAVLILPAHVGAELDKGRGVKNAVFVRVYVSASILEQQLYVWVSVFVCFFHVLMSVYEF